jgi:hypothetical protein
MAPFKVQKRSGRRQPLGVVSANTSYLPPKYSASSVAKANVGGGDYDDEVSVASSSTSRFSYRGIKDKLSKKKRGLISTIVASSKRGGGKSSSASTAALNRLFDEDGSASCDAFAYENFARGDVRSTREMDEDDESSSVREISTATLEVVDLEGRNVSNPRVICDIPTSAISPSWSEYGSAMLEKEGLSEEAASFIDWMEKDAVFSEPSSHNTSKNDATEEIATGGDSKEGCVPNTILTHDSANGTDQPCEGDGMSPSLSPPNEYVNVDLGRVPPSSAYCPPVSSVNLSPSKTATSHVVDPLSIEIERGCKMIDRSKLKSAFDREDIALDDLESGTTRYIQMNDVATSSRLIHCFAPLMRGVSIRTPAVVAMAFGIAVILLHIIWVISMK